LHRHCEVVRSNPDLDCFGSRPASGRDPAKGGGKDKTSMFQEILTHHTNNALHHAYLIIAPPEVVRVEAEQLISTILGAPLAGHADYWSHTAETFGIDESREFRMAQSRRAFGERRCFLIAAHVITEPAEDALLKTLEEPTAGNHFFIITPSFDAIRPTVRSRCYILQIAGATESNALVQKFLAGSTPERMKLMEKFLPKKNAVVEDKRKLKRELGTFCSALEVALHAKYPVSPKTAAMYESLAKMKSYLADNGAAVRLIAEHVALVLPN